MCQRTNGLLGTLTRFSEVPSVDGQPLQLLLRDLFLHHVDLDRARGEEAIDHHGLGLTDTMTPVLCLREGRDNWGVNWGVFGGLIVGIN